MKFFIKFAILVIAMCCFVLFYNQGQYMTVSPENQYKTIAIFLGILILLNTFVKPILKLLTLPLNCMTFGLFSFVLNFAIVYLADKLVDSFQFTSLFNTFLFSIVFALLCSVLDFFLKDRDDD